MTTRKSESTEEDRTKL